MKLGFKRLQEKGKHPKNKRREQPRWDSTGRCLTKGKAGEEGLGPWVPDKHHRNEEEKTKKHRAIITHRV